MSMQHLETELRRTGDPRKQAFADVIAGIHKSLGSDIPFPSVLVEKLVVQTPEVPVEIKTFSRDQLILPEPRIPQEVSDILQRAEKAGIGVFEVYHLSDVVLEQNSNVVGWNKRPEGWFWDQIKNGKVSKDAARLPDSWVLVDKTQKPDYKDGKQMYENDPFGSFLKQLRKDKKIQTRKDIPETSRFAISHDELTQVVLPKIAKLLEIESSQVRLPKEIEFNVIGNFKYPEWRNTNTWEWFADKFGDGYRLVGGGSDSGGLALVYRPWSDRHYGRVGFRPLVVVPTKA